MALTLASFFWLVVPLFMHIWDTCFDFHVRAKYNNSLLGRSCSGFAQLATENVIPENWFTRQVPIYVISHAWNVLFYFL